MHSSSLFYFLIKIPNSFQFICKDNNYPQATDENSHDKEVPGDVFNCSREELVQVVISGEATFVICIQKYNTKDHLV